MKLLFFMIGIVTVTLSMSIPLLAQKVELSEDPQTVEVGKLPSETPTKNQPTGKGAAQKFFKNSGESSTVKSTSGDEHYLMVGLGSFINSKAYKWGPADRVDDPGRFNAGVTYRFGEWTSSMDFMMRIEYQMFDVDASQDPKKFSILPMLIFPDARSGFPLYFGVGLGLGIFMDQPNDESNLSLDYQLVLGGRVLNVFNSVGFFAETGLKNHLHLLSSGQFDGVFFTIGSVFTF
jgi:hypothetical protein